MISYTDFEKLAYWTTCEWSIIHVWNCFSPQNQPEYDYWSNKFDSNVILFFLLLDKVNKRIFHNYLSIQLDNWNP